jgi:hypothetical protein
MAQGWGERECVTLVKRKRCSSRSASQLALQQSQRAFAQLGLLSVYELRKVPFTTWEGRNKNVHHRDYLAHLRKSGGRKAIEASQKWILTAVLTLEGGERYSLWSHC